MKDSFFTPGGNIFCINTNKMSFEVRQAFQVFLNSVRTIFKPN